MSAPMPSTADTDTRPRTTAESIGPTAEHVYETIATAAGFAADTGTESAERLHRSAGLAMMAMAGEDPEEVADALDGLARSLVDGAREVHQRITDSDITGPAVLAVSDAYGTAQVLVEIAVGVRAGDPERVARALAR